MPELLIEIRSEEIPARMQARAAQDLGRLVADGLKAAGLAPGATRVFSTPRRLCLVAEEVPAAGPDTREERRGPRVGAPDAAVEGFCAGAGVSRSALRVQETPKGAFHIATIETPGRAARDVLAELVPQILWSFPWPKSMRWGAGPSGLASKLVWVRPIHSLIVLFDGQVVPVSTARGDDDGHALASGRATAGHRFMGPEPFEVADFADYRARLRRAHVMLDPAERREVILTDAAIAATRDGLELVEDPDLLDEVAGLVEWPVPLIGRIDDAFMDVPAEVLTVTMRTHQKYFALRDKATGRMAPRFLTVANLLAQDGGAAVVAGNERVLRARLSDAKFFWDQDRAQTLESRLPLLDHIVFHAKLGSLAEKVARVRRLAGVVATRIGADAGQADRAAQLAKADLVTGVVGEFPELQGIMGRYYALHDGEAPAVAEAIGEHWKPQGPGDACPTAPVSVAVALADKIDTLTGFFGVGEKPTGSKDPFALRRAALGVIRLILENRLRLALNPLFAADGLASLDLIEFLADRLKVALREKGVRHDLIEAVFALGDQDDLVLVVARVEALQAFLATEDGANLLAGVRRATNILRIEEKKDKAVFAGPADRSGLVQDQERALAAALDSVMPRVLEGLAGEDFSGAMAALAGLRAPIDAFFEQVTVNAGDPALRHNRLKLLDEIRTSLKSIADFSKIEG